MFHRSELGEFAHLVPCDHHGMVPEPADDWRSMDWGLDAVDACDADVIELLDDIWWPQLVQLAEQVRQKARELGERS